MKKEHGPSKPSPTEISQGWEFVDSPQKQAGAEPSLDTANMDASIIEALQASSKPADMAGWYHSLGFS